MPLCRVSYISMIRVMRVLVRRRIVDVVEASTTSVLMEAFEISRMIQRILEDQDPLYTFFAFDDISTYRP